MPIGGTNGNPFPFGGNNQPGGFNPQGPGGQYTVVSFFQMHVVRVTAVC